ncbi:MAG: hypothetical protein AAF078_00305 [Planctomycetota bacterium]
MRLRLGGWLAALALCVVTVGGAGVGWAETGSDSASAGARGGANPIGSIDGDRYTNAHFGVAFETPEGWHRGNDEMLAQAIRLGKASVDEDLERLIDATEQNTTLVFFVSEHEVGAPVAFNRNINFLVERLTHAPGIKTTADYVAAMGRTVEQTPSLRQHEGVEAREMAGVTWLSKRQTLTMMGFEIEQLVFARFEGGHGMVITLSAMSEDRLLGVEEELAGGLEGL